MNTPCGDHVPSVAVVGAGISGLACAGDLAAAGWRVQVFDKSRGPGGRVATRRTDQGGFDHGAQYFTVRDESFSRAVDGWRREGAVSPWAGRIVRFARDATAGVDIDTDRAARMVGTPGMSALGRALARGLDIACESTILRARRLDAGWELTVAANGGLAEHALPQRWDWLVCAAPAPQTAQLLAEVPSLAAAAAARTMQPCWAVMVDLDPVTDPGWDAAFIDDSRLAWAAREASRPGRAPGGRWVLHASVAWTLEHLEDDADTVATRLLEAFRERSGLVDRVRSLRAHRWRYARPDDALPPLPRRCLFDADARAGACGDWTSAGRIEDAWLSGRALAAELRARSAGVIE